MYYIDKFLDRITMYRLVLYALIAYVVIGVGFAFTNSFSFGPTQMLISLALIAFSAFAADYAASKYFKVPTNSESWLITSFIMFLIIQPAGSLMGGVALIVAGVISSASKFLFSWNNKHIFNPAALGAAVVSLTALQPTTWWIGSSVFWPFTLILGFAVVRKIRRLPLFITFILISVVVQVVVLLVQSQPLVSAMRGALIASPLLFLSTIMLTEPATMPPRRNGQIIFAALVAMLYILAPSLGPFVVYPEVALLIGNLYAFAVSPKFRVRLRLKEVQRISDKVYNFVFQPDKRFNFIPGQYMEWTLPNVPYDSRGNRRTLTIASSPTEEDIHLGIKFYEPSSAYKATLMNMQPGDSIYASQLAGNFTIDASQDKLAFIAGGIGITPFRSMVKYLSDMQASRDIILLYIVPELDELAYAQVFIAARAIGVNIIPIVTRTSSTVTGVVNGKFNQALLMSLIPDYLERTFYISGPSSMVDSSKKYIANLGVSSSRVKTDHFTGY